MHRYIVIKCCLNAEEYVGLAHIADDAGISQSAMVRQLIKREISAHAIRVLAEQHDASPKQAQD